MVESLSDKLDALEAIYLTQVDATSLCDLAARIGNLFADNGDSPIVLATAHRSKGLENQRIFLLQPNDLPLTWEGQQNWQLQQEQNLLYVALTRAKAELILVGEPDWLADDAKATSKQVPEEQDSPVLTLCKELGIQAVIQQILRSASPEELSNIKRLVKSA